MVERQRVVSGYEYGDAHGRQLRKASDAALVKSANQA